MKAPHTTNQSLVITIRYLYSYRIDTVFVQLVPRQDKKGIYKKQNGSGREGIRRGDEYIAHLNSI